MTEQVTNQALKAVETLQELLDVAVNERYRAALAAGIVALSTSTPPPLTDEMVERLGRYLDVYAHADDGLIIDSDGGNTALFLGDVRTLLASIQQTQESDRDNAR